MVALGARAPAQPQPVILERVVHLWVDPMYGDDQKALDINPGPACVADRDTQATTPLDVLDPNSNRLLLHAAQPFRTITAAVDYVWRLSPNATTPPLPYFADQYAVTVIESERVPWKTPSRGSTPNVKVQTPGGRCAARISRLLSGNSGPS